MSLPSICSGKIYPIAGNHDVVNSTAKLLKLLSARVEKIVATGDVFVDTDSYVGEIQAQGKITEHIRLTDGGFTSKIKHASSPNL